MSDTSMPPVPGAPDGKSVFLANLHYFFAQTDGTYAYPTGAVGDLLKRAKHEIETLPKELEVAKSFNKVAVRERDRARQLLSPTSTVAPAVFPPC